MDVFQGNSSIWGPLWVIGPGNMSGPMLYCCSMHSALLCSPSLTRHIADRYYACTSDDANRPRDIHADVERITSAL